MSLMLFIGGLFEIIDDIKGDIVECGVGRGRSLITILAINRLKK